MGSYDIFYNDTGSAHRGVCIYIKSCFDAYLDDNLSSSRFSESVWCRIPLAGNDLMLVGVIYQSPNSDVINFGKLCNLMNLALCSSSSHVLVTGNCNMPHIDWTSRTVTSQSSKDAEFLDLVDDLFLSQRVNFPTRVRESQVPSLLDLVTNDENFFHPWVKMIMLLSHLSSSVISILQVVGTTNIIMGKVIISL